MKWPGAFLRVLWCERGQGMVEYALLLVLISIVVIAAMKIVGGETCKMISQSASEISEAKK